MKIRSGFVSNSSSCSFFITNLTNEIKTLIDFVKENPQLVDMYNKQYGSVHADLNHGEVVTLGKMLISAEENNDFFSPLEKKYCVFGDEQGTLVGKVFDYILREGGTSPSFKWEFDEYHR